MKSYLPKEYEDLALEERWLDEKRAQNAYDYALKYSGKIEIGLNEETVYNIEKHIVSSESVAQAWVRQRLSNKGTVQIVYSPHEVCIVNAEDFLAKWISIFAPSRDDAMIIHNADTSVMFYYHEEWLYVGHRAI